MRGQRFGAGPLDTLSCGSTRLIASSTDSVTSAARDSPVRITAPAVVVVSGLPPGSVERSNGRVVAQPRTSNARGSGSRREGGMADLRVGGLSGRRGTPGDSMRPEGLDPPTLRSEV